MAKFASQRIVIVGGGASGALRAAHLLRDRPANLSVTIVEARAELGRGLAYSTGNPSHFLNVRAANMSAFADDPDHFTRWLSRQADAPAAPEDPEFRFVSRGLYGRYLESLVLEHVATPKGRRHSTVVQDQARDLSVTPSGIEIALAASAPIRAEVAILACGHEGLVDESPIYLNPWSEPLGGGPPKDATLLILGTGLTMVDTALALEERGHRGTIVAVSWRGLLPHAHRRVEPLPIDAKWAPFDPDLSAMLAWLRGLAVGLETRGGDWRAVVDGLRPHTQSIWRAMTPRRRERFLEHARPRWDIHRHRMAPEIAARIGAMIVHGRLEIVSAKVVDAIPEGDGARVTLRRRGSRSLETLSVARIISCKGVRSNPEQSANPLVASLLAREPRPRRSLRIGIEVDPDCAILDSNSRLSPSRLSPRLLAIGPMSQAAFWEIVAVPDIRLQAAALSQRLLPTAFGLESSWSWPLRDDGPRSMRSSAGHSSVRE